MTSESRRRLRQSIYKSGFNRQDFTQDKKFNGEYEETWRNAGGDQVIIKWQKRDSSTTNL